MRKRKQRNQSPYSEQQYQHHQHQHPQQQQQQQQHELNKRNIIFSNNYDGGYRNYYPPYIYNTFPQYELKTIEDLEREKLLIEKELELQKLKTELANERARNINKY